MCREAGDNRRGCFTLLQCGSRSLVTITCSGLWSAYLIGYNRKQPFNCASSALIMGPTP